MEIINGRTTELMISKTDLDYTYDQMKPSDETGNFSTFYRFKKELYGLADIPTIFQVKTDRTMEICTPALLDDLIVVTRGDRKEHK